MTAVLLGIAWTAGAVLVGIVVGRSIAGRDRQVPVDQDLTLEAAIR